MTQITNGVNASTDASADNTTNPACRLRMISNSAVEQTRRQRLQLFHQRCGRVAHRER